MPGGQSLREQKYYANPNNQFWNIIYYLFAAPFDVNYSRRIQFIQERGIALWDVIKTCHREGSLDSKIKDETVNDFNHLFSVYPNLEIVAFNGTKAYDTYKKKVGLSLSGVAYLQLPSTSPANTIGLEKKLNQWKVILDYF